MFNHLYLDNYNEEKRKKVGIMKTCKDDSLFSQPISLIFTETIKQFNCFKLINRKLTFNHENNEKLQQIL